LRRPPSVDHGRKGAVSVAAPLPLMSDSAARVERYADDAVSIVKSGVEPKLCSEVKKLRTWLQKHQSETLPDGAKQKLLAAVETYFLYCRNTRPERFDGDVGDAVVGLVDDLLKLPEGKLIAAKSKQKALKWLEATKVSAEAASSSSSSGGGGGGGGRTKWVVADIDEETGKLMLMRCEPGLC